MIDYLQCGLGNDGISLSGFSQKFRENNIFIHKNDMILTIDFTEYFSSDSKLLKKLLGFFTLMRGKCNIAKVMNDF